MTFPSKAVTLALCGALLGLCAIWTANTGHPRYALAISLMAAATALAALRAAWSAQKVARGSVQHSLD